MANNSVVKAVVQVVALLTCLSLFGCATNRSEIQLSSPAPAAAVAGGPEVVIRNVTDEREFVEKPKDPSMPSLGFGGAEQAEDELKSRAVGRKRNAYGKALGDVVMEPGQTVVETVRESLELAFAEAGYQVKSEAAAGPDALIVDVQIDRFWAWFRPGAVTISLNMNIETQLVLSSAAAPLTVMVEVSDSYRAATDEAWVKIIDQALVEYRKQARSTAEAQRQSR